MSGGMTVLVMAEAAIYAVKGKTKVQSITSKGAYRGDDNSLDTVLGTFLRESSGETNQPHLRCAVVGLPKVSWYPNVKPRIQPEDRTYRRFQLRWRC